MSLPAHLQRYRDAGLWPGRTVADAARAWAASDPDLVVFPAEPRRPTYAGLLGDAEALAAALHELGLRAGDVVSFQTFNCVEAVVINLAAAVAGLVVNPIVPIYRDAEVGAMLSECGARVFFHPAAGAGFDYGAMAERLRPGLPALLRAVPVGGGDTDDGFAALVRAGRGRTRDWPLVDPDGVKLLLYTSGTTGRAKAVLHSHNTLGRVCAVSFAAWGLGAGDAVLMPSPVTHVSGYANGLEQPFLAGTRTVLMTRWNADEALDLIARHDIAGTVAATPFLKELADAARARGVTLPGFRVFACGGAAVPAALVREANTAFAQPCAFRVYGASEVPLVTLGVSPRDQPEEAAATDGAIGDYEVLLADAAGDAVAAGAEGEILVRGPSMFLGYADAGQTAEALTPDGYFRTGDLGVRLAGDLLLITGRKKDLIIRGGENISAQEIEDVLRRHPAVADVAVVSMPHPRLGEGVCAFVVAHGVPPDPGTLAGFVGESGLARQKCPERIEFVDDLPRTAAGKVRKDVLRARIRALMGEA